MTEFILNNEPAKFPNKLTEISPWTMDLIRKSRPKDDKDTMNFSTLSDILIELGEWTDKQKFALTHSTQIGKLVMQPPFMLLHTLLLVEPKNTAIHKFRLKSFEKTSLGNALEFFYRSQAPDIENKIFLVAQQMDSDKDIKERYALASILPFQELDSAMYWLIGDYNEVSTKGSRSELGEQDDYTAANKPSPRVKAIYDQLGWDLIVEQLPNFTLCKGMNEQQIREIEFGAILDELVKIKRLNLSSWYQHKDHEAEMKEKYEREKRRR